MKSEVVLSTKIRDLYGSTQKEEKECIGIMREWGNRFYATENTKGDTLLEYAEVIPVAMLRRDYGCMPSVQLSICASAGYMFVKPSKHFSAFAARLRYAGLSTVEWPLIADSVRSMCDALLKRHVDDIEQLVQLPLVVACPRPSVFGMISRLFVEEGVVRNTDGMISVPIASLLQYDPHILTSRYLQDVFQKKIVLKYVEELRATFVRYGLGSQHGAFLT